MPYVITTKRVVMDDVPDGSRDRVVSRLAVATLDEARIRGQKHVLSLGFSLAQAGWPKEWPEAGGSVGPLPDGTTITVEPVGWRRIEDDLGYHLGYPGSQTDALAAWNAAQEGPDGR
jgi:hypothetical protein